MLGASDAALIFKHILPNAMQPGVVLAMLFVIYALNVLGDALRDALDPKLLDR